MGINNEEKPKNDYLTIPIETYKCEILIRRFIKLTTLEKLTLKYIYKDNSLLNLINAFNVGIHVMNLIIAKIFYNGLIRLNLNEGTVELSDVIINYVKNNNLDDYLEEQKSYKRIKMTFIQEKIGGEILLENCVDDFFKNPDPDSTNYFDLKIIPGRFPNMKDFSTLKFAKCARQEIYSDLENIEKIEFIKPLHFNKLYIPLIKADTKRFLDLDYDIIPKHVQKVWQNEFDAEYATDEKDKLDLKIPEDETQYYTIKLIKNQIFTLLNSLNSMFNEFTRYENKLDFKNDYEIISEKISKFIEKLKERISSVNDINLYLKNGEDFNAQFTSYLMNASKFIIISSNKLDLGSILYLKPIIKDLLLKNIQVVLLWGIIENKTPSNLSSKLELFESNLKSGISNISQQFLHIYQSNSRIDTNFVIVDGIKLIYSNLPFLEWNYDLNRTIAFIEICGGTIPLFFLEFSINHLPNRFKEKSEFNRMLLEQNSTIQKSLTNDRQSCISNLDKRLKVLDINIRNNNSSEITKNINDLKSIVGSCDGFDTVYLIQDQEHRDFLLDTLKIANKSIHLITDELNARFFGPHLLETLKALNNISFKVKLNKFLLNSEDESNWVQGISKLEKLTEMIPRFEFLEFIQDILLNLFIIENKLILYTNYRFFAPRTITNYDFYSERIGLLIESKAINSELIKFSDEISLS